MSRDQSFLVGLAGCTVLALAFASSAIACDSPDRNPKIKVKVENGQPAVDPDSLNVCVGDTVHWVFAGSKNFKVTFTSADDSPFDWADKNGASVDGTVKAGAVKNGASTAYKYSVEVDGVVLDPKIVVDP